MDWTSRRVTAILENALLEDRATRDATTYACIDANQRATATIVAKQGCILAGLGCVSRILDVFAMLEDEFNEKAFADPAAARRDYRGMSEDELRIVARNRESAARFAWSPYMHDPKLRDRLHRITIPTLVLWGTSDRLIEESYGRAFCAAVPGAKFEQIEGAGHFPHLERTKIFAEHALAFAALNSRC